MPPGMDFVTAASVMYTYGTAYHALKNRAHLQPDETLLVLGAGGGVGLATVQLGALMGANVIAGRPPDETHPYGHRRFETIAALVEGWRRG